MPNSAPYGFLEYKNPREVNLTRPGVRGKLKRKISGISLKDNLTVMEIDVTEKVIIQPLSSDVNQDTGETAHRYLITTYKTDDKNARPDMPESHRDIIIGESVIVETNNPQKIISFNNEYYRLTREPLFPTETSPSLDEINQGVIPDCSFLSAIQAVLTHPNGASFIRGMMRQNADGSTTVRLYDPNTKSPTYVRVENSILHDSDGQLSKHTALWVHMLEKAFATLGIKDDNKKVDASVSSVYSGGITGQLALRAITGLDVTTAEINPRINGKHSSQWGIIAYLNHPVMKEMIELTQKTAVNHTMKKKECDEKIKSIFWDFLPGIAHITHAEIFEIFPELTEEAAMLRVQELLFFALEHPHNFGELKDRQKSNKVVAHTSLEITDAYLRLQKKFSPSAPFSGQYSVDEMRFYGNLKRSLNDGALLTTATHQKFSTKVDGLVGRHAYTILSVGNTTVSDKPVYFVELRNPWGHAGRSYFQNKKTLAIHAEKSTDGIFRLELTEFLKHFSTVTQTNSSADTLFTREAEKEKLTQEIYQLLGQWRIGKENSTMDIIDANRHMQLIEQKLLSLESLATHELTELQQLVSTQKLTLTILVSHEANRLNERLDELEKSAAPLSVNIHAHLGFDCPNVREKTLNDFFAADALFNELTMTQLFLQNNANLISDKTFLSEAKNTLERISTHINKCEEDILHHIDTEDSEPKKLFKENLAARHNIQTQASDLRTKRVLSDAALSAVHFALQSPSGKKLSQLGEKYQQSTNEEIKNLGEKMSFVSRGWEKLCSFFRTLCNKTKSIFFGSNSAKKPCEKPEVNAIVPLAEV